MQYQETINLRSRRLRIDMLDVHTSKNWEWLNCERLKK